MFALVYVSTATIRWSDTDLERLLEQSRRDNFIAEITGLLLFKDGNFMQILEGAKDAVLSLLAKIRSDARHQRLVVIFEEERPHREFKDWSMGFKRVDSGTGLSVTPDATGKVVSCVVSAGVPCSFLLDILSHAATLIQPGKTPFHLCLNCLGERI